MTSSLKAVLRTGSLSGVGCVIGIIGLETTRCTGIRFWRRGQLGVVSPVAKTGRGTRRWLWDAPQKLEGVLLSESDGSLRGRG